MMRARIALPDADLVFFWSDTHPLGSAALRVSPANDPRTILLNGTFLVEPETAQRHRWLRDMEASLESRIVETQHEFQEAELIDNEVLAMYAQYDVAALSDELEAVQRQIRELGIDDVS